MSVLCLRYRLFPTKAQETLLSQTLAICCDVYNSMVNWRTAVYETEGKTLSWLEQKRALPIWKQKHPELVSVHSMVLQDITLRVDRAFQSFFRRIKSGEKPGYPRMKGGGVYDSITYPRWGNGVKLEGEILRVSKIGQLKARIHRPLVGTPKICTIRRRGGKWFACIACAVEPEPLPRSEKAIGVDVGLEKFATFSDGSFVENPCFFRREEKALARAQRKLSKRPKRDLARRKAKKVASRIHERIRNRRRDFVHQLSRRLVNGYGIIAVEKLNVSGMVKNHRLAKCIFDAAWSQFRTMLAYKAESAGRLLVEVNPAYTSQDCSGCGYRAKKPLKERWHLCPMCGLSLDRDMNAALNILRTAVGQHSVGSCPKKLRRVCLGSCHVQF